MGLSDLNVLFIADIVGQPGFAITAKTLPNLLADHQIHLAVANGENAAFGKGLTARIAREIFDLGIDVITSGNHIWNRDKFMPTLDSSPKVLRPLNYPDDAPGHGSCVVSPIPTVQTAIINLQGRSFMYSIDCPFRALDREIERLSREGVRIFIVDFHAEATAEKVALGWYADGRISALIGTHTHIQTADERILPKGTAYITDAGMTGASRSVIGMDTETAIQRFMSQRPVHYKGATEEPILCGVVISIDPQTGRSKSIKRLFIHGD